tara:strand:- start:4469 stop:4636 length:168 start_codon:yes stop_codon:yes gene_type:complete
MEDPTIQIGKGVYNMSDPIIDEIREQMYEALREEFQEEFELMAEERDYWPRREEC